MLMQVFANSTAQRSVLFVLLCIQVAQIAFVCARELIETADAKEDGMYENCRSSKKMCFGESRHCIEKRSCTLLATVTESDSVFNVSFLDKCQRGSNDSFFYAVSAATFNDRAELDCSKELMMTDIKVFLFWKGAMCPGGNRAHSITNSGVTKSQYESHCERKVNENYGKKLLNTLDRYNSTTDIDLNFYLNNFARFSTVKGEWGEANRPFAFPKNLSYATKDQVFYSTVEDELNGSHNDGSPNFTMGYFATLIIIYWTFSSVINSPN